MRGRSTVVYSDRGPEWLRTHEAAALGHVAGVVARLTGSEWAGYCLSSPPRTPAFVIPDETLLEPRARDLGIEGPADFLGGIVPFAVLGTKAIVHPLVAPTADRPAGWPDRFVAAVQDVVLPGLTAFSVRDAEAAARRLLAEGPVRVKPTRATGSRGQVVIRHLDGLAPALAEIRHDEIARFGVVLEMNLEDVTTLSVGQITIDGLTLSYHGVQRETRDNDGRPVYGGSDLLCVRGGWAALAACVATPAVRLAVEHARRYDRAAHALVGLVASRRNYDIGRGIDAERRRRAGIFEHSWRVGGATPAEIAAFEAFRANARRRVVRAATVERYGRDVHVPLDAIVQFQGDDANVGPITRYTRVGERATEAA